MKMKKLTSILSYESFDYKLFHFFHSSCFKLEFYMSLQHINILFEIIC